MAVGYFLMPMVGDGAGENAYRAKYQQADDFSDPAGWGRTSTIHIYPDLTVVRIVATGAMLTEVSNDPDVFTIGLETALDETVTTPQANSANTLLEGKGFPGTVVQAGQTRRQSLRRVVGIARLAVELKNRFGEDWKERIASAGLTFETTWSALPQSIQDEFLAVATDEGWTAQSLGLTASSTLREVLFAFGQAWTKWGRPFE